MDTLPKLSLPKVIAHRGAPTLTPENTLASLRKAAELGASWVEFDAMLTADGIPIVIHDDTLSRTTNGEGIVADTPYVDIANLDAGSWFSPEFAEQKVPHLGQFIEVAHRLGLGINLEIKAAPGREKETAKVILEVLQRHWLSGDHKLLISSSCIEILRATHQQFSEFLLLRQMAEDASEDASEDEEEGEDKGEDKEEETVIPPKLHLALLLEEWTPGWQDALTSLNCTSLNVHHSMLTLERVNEAKRLVEYVLAYTVNDLDTAQHCYDLGVDAVFSDNLLLSTSSSSAAAREEAGCS
jgi:glycerophosphoryl diester phosphodiesterase